MDGNSQDPERERRPFSRTLAIPMIHQTHTTCVSTECMRELITPKTTLVAAKPMLSVCCQLDGIYNACHEAELFYFPNLR